MRPRDYQFSSIRSFSNIGFLAISSLAIALALSLTCFYAMAGPANSTPPPAQAGSSGKAQSAASSQLAKPAAPAVSRQNAASGGSVQNLPATNANPTLIDNGRAVLGGSVFSTGTDDIILTVPAPVGLPLPQERVVTVVNGQRMEVPNPNVSVYVNSIVILASGQERVLASNRQYNRTINLGKLPPGETIFGIQTSQGNLFRTGDGSRNPDHIPHAIIKSFLSGLIEVWFEDQPGARLPSTDRDFNDAVFQLSGGVADNNAVAELIKAIREQQGEARQRAINTLQQINPKAVSIALAPVPRASPVATSSTVGR